jgi:hypothetical protein
MPSTSSPARRRRRPASSNYPLGLEVTTEQLRQSFVQSNTLAALGEVTLDGRPNQDAAFQTIRDQIGAVGEVLRSEGAAQRLYRLPR